jgi:hypothetical protein
MVVKIILADTAIRSMIAYDLMEDYDFYAALEQPDHPYLPFVRYGYS